MTSILLATLNARYIHCSLGLRYLMANMGDLCSQTKMLEYVIDTPAIDTVEELLNHSPKIIGFGVYIWNVAQTTAVVSMLKEIQPEIIIVLGGPEISYEYDKQVISEYADYIVTGQADLVFPKLCEKILNNSPPKEKIIKAALPTLKNLKFPYAFYTDEDISNRVIYVEASRGCPFKCEFCLSALDKTATAFDLELFLLQLQKLYDRGARQFKFVDRTFNLKVDTCSKILEFFINRLDEHLFIHFELIPDRLSEKLKQLIIKFPPGTLQFEIGIQSFNPKVQQLIDRRQDNEKTKSNISWLCSHSNVYCHADLIVGLPGDDISSIADSFNQLVALNPHEIQMGILKRLRGTPIIKHTLAHDMKYNPLPPYNILYSKDIDFSTMQRLKRFARYWDMVGNSGRFRLTLPVILSDQPFQHFFQFSDLLFQVSKRTHKIALNKLFDFIYQILTENLDISVKHARGVLCKDYEKSGFKSPPGFLGEDQAYKWHAKNRKKIVHSPTRQARHLN